MALKLKSFPSISICVVIIPLLLLSHNLYTVSAASGGRMGGSSFSSNESPSSRFDHHYHDHYHHSSTVSKPTSAGNANEENDSIAPAVAFLFIFICLGLACCFAFNLFLQEPISVLRLQVGLSAKAHSLQRNLSEIALTTDTSTAKGWNFILEETIQSLLRHQDFYLYGYSYVTRFWTLEDAEKHFKRLSRKERMKFEVESLVNINNIKRQRAVVPKANSVDKDQIVVTVLVAAKGAHSLPAIKITNNVKEAFKSLANINSNKLKAVEVLWSPQDETDSLSVEELLEYYPHLKQLC